MGARFLNVDPITLGKMTLRQFRNAIKGRQEAIYDQLELMSFEALMMRKAYHTDPKKTLKPRDMFRRPNEDELVKDEMEQAVEKLKRQQEILNKLNLGEGGQNNGR